MAQAINKLFGTDNKSYVLTFLRVVAAIVILPHGAQKLFGWFGGYGWEGTLNAFNSYMGIPYFLGALAILAETLGGLSLLTGLFTRVSAIGLGIVMLVATFTVHLQNGFFMNWGGTATGEGFEYHILYFAIVLVLAIKGAGAFAVDSFIVSKLEQKSKMYFKLQGAN